METLPKRKNDLRRRHAPMTGNQVFEKEMRRCTFVVAYCAPVAFERDYTFAPLPLLVAMPHSQGLLAHAGIGQRVGKRRIWRIPCVVHCV